MAIRSTAKAVVLHQGKVLLNHCQDENNGDYYSLPGGGQHPGESLHQAVMREVLEETGYSVTPVEFCGVFEEICNDPELLECYPEYHHKMYHFFLCNLAGEKAVPPTQVDPMQLSSQWIALEELANIRILPEFLSHSILGMTKGEPPRYFGVQQVAKNHG